MNFIPILLFITEDSGKPWLERPGVQVSAKKKETVKKQEPCALSLPADRPRPHGHILPACGEGQLSSLTGMKQENPSVRVRCSGGGRMRGLFSWPYRDFPKGAALERHGALAGSTPAQS